MNPLTRAIKDVLLKAEQELAAHGVALPRLDAMVLLAHALGTSRETLLVSPDAQVRDEYLRRFCAYVERRARHEPVAYIIGEKEFWSLSLTVTPAVLIPRPETEQLVEWVVNKVRRRHPSESLVRILEIATGSGAIACALANELPYAAITATDISADALEVARENIRRHGFENSITLLQSDLYADLPADVRYDVICSNPPYIPTAQMTTLDAEVVRYEPHLALSGGADGMRYLRVLLGGVDPRLHPAGFFIFEIFSDIAPALLQFAKDANPDFEIELHRDYAGHVRLIAGTRGI